MQSYFRNLIVWQKSFALSEKIYQITKNFPPDERYGLTDQMRRASVSIASNIAEGSARGTNAEYAHFLHIAKGSASELITQALLCQSFGYIDDVSGIVDMCEEIIKMIHVMIKNKS